jgi:uncharacterized membrane protein
MYELLLAIHLLAAVMWAGGGITLHVIGRRFLRDGDHGAMLAFNRETGWMGQFFYAPLSLVVIVAGVLLVDEAGYELDQLWISLGFTGWLIAFVIGAFIYPRLAKRRDALIAERGETGDVAEQSLRRLLNVNSIEILVMALVIVDMAAKPGA